MGAPSKRARTIRTKGEFDLARLRQQLAMPAANYSGFVWDLDRIYSARDAQMRGDFRSAARLAESTKTDSAIYSAFENRLAPQECVSVGLEAAKGARGASIANEAEGHFGAEGIAITPDTQSEITGHLADLGAAFGYCNWTPRDDGSRIDLTITSWPCEHVWWDEHEGTFKTRTRNGFDERIVHGDGRWLVFKKREHKPWLRGAILAIALVWARHAFGVRDQAKASLAHGMAKMMGEMPKGVALQDNDGNLTEEAAAFIELLRGMLDGDAPVGIRPAESKTDFVASASTAYQIFDQLLTRAEKAAARIYLGTDGMLGAGGGAPGVDIGALFGVGETIVQSDFNCLERGFNTAIEIWTAVNFGDSSLAPKRRFLVPDADEDALCDSYAKRTTSFYDAIDRAKRGGFVVDQKYVDALAKRYRVESPTLIAASGPTPTPAPPTSTPEFAPPAAA